MMTANERKYLDQVARLGCALCRHMGISDTPAEIHHPRTGAGAARKSSHYDAIPMCPQHHRLGNDALHVMGRKAFERHHGITEMDLLQGTKNLMGGGR